MGPAAAMESDGKSDVLFAIIAEILRLQSCFEGLFSDVDGGSTLSTLQKLVLSAVFDAGGASTVPQIGRTLGRPRQVIQRIVNELVGEGLLAKSANPHHKRASLLTPTAKARDMRRRAEAQAARTAQGFLSTISEDRCQALIGELRALRAAIEVFTETESPVADEQAVPSRTGLLALL